MLRAALILGAALLILAGGTYAVFSDVERSEGNYIEAGTLDLVLTDSDYSADGRWQLSNAEPGDTVGGTNTLRIYNNGSVEADHVEIAFSACYSDLPDVESDTNKTGIGNWLKEILVVEMTYSTYSGAQTKLVWYEYVRGAPQYMFNSDYLEDVDGDNLITLFDLMNQVIDGLTPPPAIDGNAPDGQSYTQFYMKLHIMNTNYEQNDWQGDTLHLTVHVALAQDSNQDVLSPGGSVGECLGAS